MNTLPEECRIPGIAAARRSLGSLCAAAPIILALTLLIVGASLSPADVLAQNVYTVSSTTDDADPGSAGTLRRAIHDANSHQNTQGLVDRIVFDIPAAGVQTITLTSDLPIIDEALHIDGTTQQSATGEPLIKIDGDGSGGGPFDVFVIRGDNSIIEGVIIVDSDDGILVERHASHQSHGTCTIRGNYIGLDENGIADANADAGVHLDDVPDCLIEENVISGNTAEGVRIEGDDASGNVVSDNYIGTDLAGAAAVPNGTHGVSIVQDAFDNSISDNIISGNGSNGVKIDGNAANAPFNNSITGNLIGLAVNGTTAMANGENGVSLIDGAFGNTVGGSTASERNIISGNTESGVFIGNSDGNFVLGNYIGTNKTGQLNRGNGVDGVQINGSDGNTIGGTSADARNVISGNGDNGVLILADDANEISNGNLIRGNYIGLRADGAADLGNAGHGVLLHTDIASGTISANQIGGEDFGAGNTIAYNDGDGVSVTESGTTRDNAILGNSIYLNDGIGIDLADDGLTVNDSKDPDAGPNDLQNFPSLSPWTVNGTTSVTGVLNSRPSSTYRIEFFSTPDPEPSAHGEGKTYLGSELVTTNSNGDAVFTASLPAVATSIFLTATATEWVGGAPGSTSEFGQAVGASGSGAVLTVNTTDGGAGDGSCDALDGLGADCSLQEAITFANATPGTVETIVFSIPGASPHVITVTMPLVILDPVIIDATAGGACDGSAPLVRIDGNGPIVAGLFINGAGPTTVRGLSITNFSFYGIHLVRGENIIECNYIGVAPDGVTDDGNDSHGVLIGGGSNVIGGSTALKGNVISGNGGAGVLIDLLGDGGNIVQHNYIGTNADGTAALPNADGVEIESETHGNVIADNLISGNDDDGIEISSDENTILGNLIGTDADGTSALPNGDDGINLVSANRNVIGGRDAGDGNVISGNAEFGVFIFGGDSNVLQGNYIGTDVSGTAAIPNDMHGVGIELTAAQNTIGGTADGAGNVISGNAFSGVYIEGADAVNTAVQGNFIGTDVSGTAAVPNGQHGIAVTDDADDTLIGGTVSGAGNLISGNGQNGILVEEISGGSTVRTYIYGNAIGTQVDGSSALGNGSHGIRIFNSTRTNVGGTSSSAGNTIAHNVEDGVNVSHDDSDLNPIRGNSIFLNGGLGIELENHTTHNGVTANDVGDGDGGPNAEQNFPAVSTANVSGSTISITGSLSTGTSTGPYRVEFFSSPTADATGFGEGRTYLGSTSATTDGTGVASFAVTLSETVAPGDFITATATDAVGNTSEFGPAVESTGTSGTVALDCPLGPGWDWFSINVTPSPTDVVSVLGGLSVAPTDDVDIIVDPGAGGFAIYSGGTWVPGTFDVLPGRGYKIFLTSASTLSVSGAPASGSIELVSGFNWIGMNSQSSQTITTALANANLTSGDLLASQSNFSIYNPPWVGGVTELEPCEGYRLMVDAGTAGFTFPAKQAGGDAPWSVNPAEFENAMYVVAELSPDVMGAPQADDFVGAFVRGEVRGVAAPTEVNGRQIFFLTVFGHADAEDVSFKAYHAATGDVVEVGGAATFVPDYISGTISDPHKWTASTTTGTEVKEVPSAYLLEQNYPNPFNPQTEIAYELPESATVKLTVFDVHGRPVRTLVSGQQSAGRHVLTWDAQDANGRSVASGVYLYRLEAGPFVKVQKMILLK